jgi:hypothetical protein
LLNPGFAITPKRKRKNDKQKYKKEKQGLKMIEKELPNKME